MDDQVRGIHHVTAIAGDPQINLDFYTGVLGLRLVKLTVNFDDPGTYHLYYGDGSGNPGTILTFFTYPGGRPGRHGHGQVGVTSFQVPRSSLDFWEQRLRAHQVTIDRLSSLEEARFGEPAVIFRDPGGLLLEIVARQDVDDLPYWEKGPIPGEQALRGFAGVTLEEEGFEATDRLLRFLGFQPSTEEGQTFRYRAPGSGPGRWVDVHVAPNLPFGRVAVGSIHHVAYRVPDDATQQRLRSSLGDAGYDVTPVLDREYFHSVYFREPGGVLFEIATDPPGFTVDEPLESLGADLKLPPWYESHREEIKAALPPLRLSNGVTVGV